MNITAAYRDWLMNPVNNDHRVLLIEADHVTGTVCLATAPYMSETGQPYDDWLPEIPVLDESLYGHVGVGSFSAVNHCNPDEWQDYQFIGQECRWYYGDLRWNRGQFQPVATAIINDVRRDEYTFEFDLVDRGFMLEKPVPLASANINDKSVEIPLTLGHVFNAPAKLIDYAHQIYQIHSGSLDIVIVRDNGVPISFTAMNNEGKFKLKNRPVGTVSCDVRQADNTLMAITRYLAELAGMGTVQQYGLSAWQRIASLGIQITGSTTYAALLDELAESVGCWWRLNAPGQIELVSDQQPVQDIVLTEDDLIDLNPDSTERPFNKIKLHHTPNLTVLDGTVIEGAVEAGVISQSLRQRLINSHRTITRTTHARTGVFNSTLERNSLITDDDQAARLMTLLSQRHGQLHRGYSGSMRAIAYGLRVGDRVNIDYPGVQGTALLTRITRGYDGDLTEVSILV